MVMLLDVPLSNLDSLKNTLKAKPALCYVAMLIFVLAGRYWCPS
jgi:hypothetical protein